MVARKVNHRPCELIGDLLRKARNAYHREGILYLIKTGTHLLFSVSKDGLLLFYYRNFESNREFQFLGKKYSYFYSLYGGTWRTERSVEIPIIWDYVQHAYKDQKRILEIGNVLSHRFQIRHDVLDKYEKEKGVINSDVVDFHTDIKYDLIVSISTLEHVGWDEEIREPLKILRSLENLRSQLGKSGELIVTLPLGQNTHMDKMIKDGILRFDEMFYMRRQENTCDWVQVKEVDPLEVEYDYKTPRANAILIGIIKA